MCCASASLYFRVTALAVLAACLSAHYAFADARNPIRARVAHTLSGNDNATLHLVHTNGSTLYEEGRASGSLPGTAHASFYIHASGNLVGHFVFYTRSGAINGHGSAKWRQGRYPYVSFSGAAEITGGTHRYVHVHGDLGFYGVMNRESSAVTIQTRGTLTY